MSSDSDENFSPFNSFSLFANSRSYVSLSLSSSLSFSDKASEPVCITTLTILLMPFSISLLKLDYRKLCFLHNSTCQSCFVFSRTLGVSLVLPLISRQLLKVRTTGWTGGLHQPLKGVNTGLTSQEVSKSWYRITFSGSLSRAAVFFAFYFLLPVNGSMYSLNVICSYV